MSEPDAHLLKAAELYEQAGKWDKAADCYLKERVFEKTVACLKKAGQLDARLMDLLAAFEPQKVLALFKAKGKAGPSQLALAHLHLHSRGDAEGDPSAFEACYGVAQSRDVNQADALRFLKGALLSASWLRDESRLARAVDLALARQKVSQVDRESDVSSDKTALLLVKIAASGEFQLLPELGKGWEIGDLQKVRRSPHVLRLLAPRYLYRGFKLTELLKAMHGFRELRDYAKRYENLFAGLSAGREDEALTKYMADLLDAADQVNPDDPIASWDDVARRFPHVVYAQPEYLSGLILWDQIWATRVGVDELRVAIAQAMRDLASKQWHEALQHFKEVLTNSLLVQLPLEMQKEVYLKSCFAAFQAEAWEDYDKWATTLEETYQVKEVLHQIAETVLEGSDGEKKAAHSRLKRMAGVFGTDSGDRAGAAYAELGDHTKAARHYAVAGDEHRDRERYGKARASYLKAARQYTLGEDDDRAQKMRDSARDCEAHLRELDQTQAMREQADATRTAGAEQANAFREGTRVMTDQTRESFAALTETLRIGFTTTTQALFNGFTALAQSQRESAMASAEIVFRGIERLAVAQSEGFAQLSGAVREGDLLQALSTYAGIRGLGRQDVAAAEALRTAIKDGLTRLPAGQQESAALHTLKLFDTMTRMLPAQDQSAPGPVPDSTVRAIVERAASRIQQELKPERAKSLPFKAIPNNCVLASGPPGVVMTLIRPDGKYQQCTLAQKAHTRRWHNFEMFSAKYLEQAGCPLPRSRGILQRHLWYKTCELADGCEHELNG